MFDDCIDHGRKGNKSGYASKSVGGSRKNGGVVVNIHRWVYAHKIDCDVRALPAGLVVRHTCDNPRCINPEHLIGGSQVDNMQDCVMRKRLPRGSDSANAKLTWADVTYIRQSSESQKALAALFKVARITIQDVINNVTWRVV